MKKTVFIVVAALAATGLKAQTVADAAVDKPLGAFDISLSPEGNKVVYVANLGRSTEAVYVAELAASGGTPKPILVHPDKASELQYCFWANGNHLVCRLDFTSDGEGNPQQFSRIFAMNAQGQEFVALNVEDIRSPVGSRQADGTVLALGPGGKPDMILMTRNWVPGFQTTTRVSQDESGFGVEEVDVAIGARRRIEPPDPSAVGYAADETGKVRFKVRQAFGPPGSAPAERSYSFRDSQSDRWHELTVRDADGKVPDFRPVAVDGGRNIAYGFVVLDGRKAAASLTLAGQGKLEILLQGEDADVGGFVTVGRQRRIVGAMLAGASSETVYFDEDLSKLASGLEMALAGKPIRFAGSSDDGNRLLIVAEDGSGSGIAYLFDRNTRQLSEVMPVHLPESGIANGM